VILQAGADKPVPTDCEQLFLLRSCPRGRAETRGKSKAEKTSDPTRLNPFDGKKPGVVIAVIETPGGSRNKFKYDEKLGFYSLSGVLPEGMVFPHAFGFVPGTRAADGAPEDILILALNKNLDKRAYYAAF
jgi:hypothetical protein